MMYPNIRKAAFLRRPNRFVAVVDGGNGEELVHVKNTGRCRELLVPGCTVWLTDSDSPGRKTSADLVAVEKIRGNGAPLLINMDSAAPNAAAQQWIAGGGIFGKGALVRREVKFGSSRFDIYAEYQGRKAFVEVKGVTLENDGIASFPDAPTERGLKHMSELISAVSQGFEAYALFVIQMKDVHLFRPNYTTHPQFGEMLVKAQENGVHILAMDCVVTPDSMTIDKNVPISLERKNHYE